MTEKQVDALEQYIREIVRKEIRDMVSYIAHEYEFSWELEEKLDELKKILGDSEKLN